MQFHNKNLTQFNRLNGISKTEKNREKKIGKKPNKNNEHLKSEMK